MSLIVSNTTPKKLKETNLSHYEMVRQFVEKLKSWGKVTYIGWNNIEFDQIFLRNTLFQIILIMSLQIDYCKLRSAIGGSAEVLKASTLPKVSS